MRRGASRLSLLVLLPLACDAGTSQSGAADSAGGGDATDIDANAQAGGATQAGGNSASGGMAGIGGSRASGGAAMAVDGPAADDGSTTDGAMGGTAGAAGVTYTTNFDLSESPLSGGGAWHHDGLDWTAVDTANGIAFGTQALGVARSGPRQYNDSYAYLSGFPADHEASAVVHLGSIDGSCTHEVEILLRWMDSAHVARGYECNVAFDGSYAQIVRWNGPVGDYTYLNNGSLPGGVHDNDTVSASIVGDKITLSVNGVVRASARDTTFLTGNPGVGFWRGSSGCGRLGDFGFTSFAAKPASP